MRKKLLTAIIILMILLSAVALASCDFWAQRRKPVLPPFKSRTPKFIYRLYGEPSVFQLRPWVIPSDAKNQELI